MNKRALLDSVNFEIKTLTEFKNEDEQKIKDTEEGGGYNAYHNGSKNAFRHAVGSLEILKAKIEMLEDK